MPLLVKRRNDTFIVVTYIAYFNLSMVVTEVDRVMATLEAMALS
jgi:hypothetical protein